MKRILLTFLIVTLLVIGITGTSDADNWMVGGRGNFLAYPFFTDGTFDGVSLKTYLVVSNTDEASAVPVVAAVHYIHPTATGIDDIRKDEAKSCFSLHDFNLTRGEPLIFEPGTRDPALPDDLPIIDSKYTLGWVELWVYTPGAGVRPPVDGDDLTGMGITVDVANTSAFAYNAIATDQPGNATIADDVSWSSTWSTAYQVPVSYNDLTTSYDLTLWVKPPDNNPNIDTVVILTNPMHRSFACSPTNCYRDRTAVEFNLVNSLENSYHVDFQLGEMRAVSFLNDIPMSALMGDTWYGRATIAENDTVDTEGCSAGTTADPYTVGKGKNTSHDGFLAIVYYNWLGSRWGVNLVDATGDVNLTR